MPTTLVCRICQQPFSVKPSHAATRRYCSRSCELSDHARKRHGINSTCARCGTEMYVQPSQVRRNKTGKYYCSNECVYLSTTEERATDTCCECGKTFHRSHSGSRYTARFCSRSCFTAYRKGKPGPPRRRYTYVRRKRFGVKETLYRGREWKEQSAACKERDNHTCQRCGASRVRIDAHHIIPYRISHNNDLSNLTTLCRPCHNTVEAEYWRQHPIAQLRLI